MNANSKNYPKILNFTFLSFSPVNRRGHLRLLSSSWNSGTQPFGLDLWATPLCPSLPWVPATVAFCLVARSIISLGICLFHPFPRPPPPSRNLIPSWQAEGQKSLKAAISTAHTQVSPPHILTDANLLFSLLHNLPYLCSAQVVTWILPSHLLPSPSSAAGLSFNSNILPCLSQRLSTSCHPSWGQQPLQSYPLWDLPLSEVPGGLELAHSIWGKESWQSPETHTITSLKSGPS